MKEQVVERKVVATGLPIPEMIAGAIMGGLASLILTYVDGVSPLMRLGSPWLYLIVGGAALLGALASMVLARDHVVDAERRRRPAVVDRERRAA
ncbi:MAG TPA: hypothetical protein VJP45_12955 [Candidatus Limnocylindria bacterium]|nr:hypothetical protein [Candidatus Limnocylindria bacterium]